MAFLHVQELLDPQHGSVPPRLPVKLLLVTQGHAKAQVGGGAADRHKEAINFGAAMKMKNKTNKDFQSTS